ncbi:hypothetical protein [Asaia platycodi]|uniref:hypothetical protein n=1 Tax=Asaia platycodi TaxID=610243 RepID=UPI00131EF6F2
MAASALLSLGLANSALNEGTVYGAQGVSLDAASLDNRAEGRLVRIRVRCRSRQAV